MGIEPTWDDLPKLQSALETAFNEIGGNHYSAICRTADGLYHIHDVVTYDKAKRRNAVSKEYGNCHVEEMRGTKEQADDYVNKRGKFEEKGEDVLVVFGDKTKIQNNRGIRTDLDDFDRAVFEGFGLMHKGFNLNNYIVSNASTEREMRLLERRFPRLLQMIQPSWRNIKVIYVEGASGSGKSRGVYKRYESGDVFRASVANKTNFPFNGYQGEKILWLDELRPGVFGHGELMELLDGYKLNVDVKYGQMPAMWTTVIITSIYPYESWYKNGISFEDGRKEFERRITERYIAKNGEWEKIEIGTSPRQDFMPINDSDIPFTN